MQEGGNCEKAILPISVISGLFILVFSFYLLTKGEPVTTRKQAIRITEEYVTNKYDEDFSEYRIKVKEYNDCWSVYYSPKIDATDVKKGVRIRGGGGPSLIIRKSDSKVLRCIRQK